MVKKTNEIIKFLELPKVPIDYQSGWEEIIKNFWSNLLLSLPKLETANLTEFKSQLTQWKKYYIDSEAKKLAHTEEQWSISNKVIELALKVIYVSNPYYDDSPLEWDILCELRRNPRNVLTTETIRILLLDIDENIGITAKLKIELLSEGKGNIYCSPINMFLTTDYEFKKSLDNSRKFLEAQNLWPSVYDIRWSIERDDKQIILSIGDPSLGGAFATSLLYMLSNQKNCVLSKIAIIAEIDEYGNFSGERIEFFRKIGSQCKELFSNGLLELVLVASDQDIPDEYKIEKHSCLPINSVQNPAKAIFQIQQFQKQISRRNFLKTTIVVSVGNYAKINNPSLSKESTKSQPFFPIMYCPWFDPDHPFYNMESRKIRLFLNTIALMAGKVVIPPSHILNSNKVINLLHNSKKELFHYGIFEATLRDDTNNYEEFVELKEEESSRYKTGFANKTQIKKFLEIMPRYYQGNSRNASQQKHLLKNLFLKGFEKNGHVYNQLSTRLGMDYSSLQKATLNFTENNDSFSSKQAKKFILQKYPDKSIYKPIIDLINGCYYYNGAITNQCFMIPDYFSHNVRISSIKKQDQTIFLEGYNPEVFLFVLRQNMISEEKIENLLPEDIIAIRTKTTVFQKFIQKYFQTIIKFNYVAKNLIPQKLLESFAQEQNLFQKTIQKESYNVFTDLYSQHQTILWQNKGLSPLGNFLDRIYSADYSLSVFLTFLESL